MDLKNRFSARERTLILEEYFATKSYLLVKRLFARSFPDQKVPNNSTISRLIRKFRETGCVTDDCKGNSGRPPTTRGQDTIEDVRNRLNQSPRKSIRKLSNCGDFWKKEYTKTNLGQSKTWKTTSDKKFSEFLPKHFTESLRTLDGDWITSSKLAENGLNTPLTIDYWNVAKWDNNEKRRPVYKNLTSRLSFPTKKALLKLFLHSNITCWNSCVLFGTPCT